MAPPYAARHRTLAPQLLARMPGYTTSLPSAEAPGTVNTGLLTAADDAHHTDTHTYTKRVLQQLM